MALPRGDGSPVLLIPGFLSGDWSMLGLRAFLRDLGYRAETANILFNPGATAAIISQLDAAFAKLSRRSGVALVGVSLGGTLARDMARRHPDKVRCLVTLCSPVRFPVTTPLEPFTRLVEPFQDAAWLARRHEVALPLDMPVTAIYTEEDGIVDWRQCLVDEAPGTRCVAVHGPHIAIASDPEARAAVAFALAGQ